MFRWAWALLLFCVLVAAPATAETVLWVNAPRVTFRDAVPLASGTLGSLDLARHHLPEARVSFRGASWSRWHCKRVKRCTNCPFPPMFASCGLRTNLPQANWKPSCGRHFWPIACGRKLMRWNSRSPTCQFQTCRRGTSNCLVLRSGQE